MAKKHLKPTLLSAAVAAALLTTAMPADAVKFTASGQINKVMSDIDNGSESALGFFDNDFSGTRFRFKGSEELDNGLTIGGYSEWQISGNPISGAEFQANGEFGEANGTLSERHADIYASGAFGKVSLGQGNGAANGTSEVDLSGTWRTDYVHGNACALGGINFGNAAITVGQPNASIDGESRNDRIRYDTPTLGEVFSAAVSLGNGGLTEYAGWLDMTFGSTQFSAAIGASDTDEQIQNPVTTTGSIQRERQMISASLLLGNGLNFTVAATEEERDGDADDNEQSYFKVGYKTGKHAFSASVSEGDGDGTLGGQAPGSGLSNVESEGTAFAYNYQAAPSLNLYAGWREVEVDDDANAIAQGSAANVEDVDSLMLGAHLTWSTN